MTSTSISAEFQAEFARLKADVETAIPTSASDAARNLLTLRQALIDAHAQLPPYDQKKYEREIRDLEARMDASRASRPKAKFAFKRTPVASRSVTPSVASASSDGAGPSTIGEKARDKKEGKDDGYAISGITGGRVTAEDITPRLSGTEKDMTLTLSSLSHCLIDLGSTPLRNLHLDRLSQCLLLLPPSPVGVLAHRLSSCVLSVPNCPQFRLHDSTGVVLALNIASYPVIEGCRAIYTMPCPPERKEGGTEGAQAEGQEEGRWNKVQDFDSPTGDSSNWRALTAEEQGKVMEAIRTSAESGKVEPALATIP